MIIPGAVELGSLLGPPGRLGGSSSGPHLAGTSPGPDSRPLAGWVTREHDTVVWGGSRRFVNLSELGRRVPTSPTRAGAGSRRGASRRPRTASSGSRAGYIAGPRDSFRRARAQRWQSSRRLRQGRRRIQGRFPPPSRIDRGRQRVRNRSLCPRLSTMEQESEQPWLRARDVVRTRCSESPGGPRRQVSSSRRHGRLERRGCDRERDLFIMSGHPEWQAHHYAVA